MRLLIPLALCLFVACGDDDISLDASLIDAAAQDSGAQDGGAQDASTEDSSSPDASGDASTDVGIDAARMDAGPTSSGGSGGLECERMGAVNGLSYCVATIDGVELKIIEPEDMSGALDLGIYLHGDGARAYEGDTALRIQAPWTRSRQTLYVAARAPNTCAWWLRPDYTACDGTGTEANMDRDGANADALVSVIRALQAAYNLNYDPILFSGSSGGAVFLTGSFLPLYGNEFHGAFALGCGGFAPYTNFVWETTRHNQGSTYLYFTYGDTDEFRSDIEGGIAAYEALDFGLDVELREGGIAHCAFDHIGWVTEAWESYSEGI